MKLFFILSLGRTGTQFLSELLHRPPQATVLHEPHGGDKFSLFYRYAGGMDAVTDQLLEARFDALLATHAGTPIYGEVNSYLRYETDWLRQKFDPVLIYLARDGRDFVRSAYTRKVYTDQDLQQPLVPRDGTAEAKQWHRWSRFQRLCWYWHHTNAHFLERGYTVHRVEACWKDYATFKQTISDPVGIPVGQSEWQAAVDRPVNTTGQRQRKQLVKQLLGRGGGEPKIAPIPHWKGWTAEQHRMFNDICGATMSQLGYSLETV